MRPQHETATESYGKPNVCDRCGHTILLAAHIGLPWALDTPLPTTVQLDNTTRHGVMEWHPNVQEWCGALLPNTGRERRPIHSTHCPR